MSISPQAPACDTTAVERSAFQVDQNELEQAILDYQEALESNNRSQIAAAYRAVYKLYPPLNFVNRWFKQYHYLYDSREDFIQDYLIKFCEVLAAWKPRDQRKASRYNGTGKFANYFIGSLRHHYSNLVKSDAAGKRNPSCCCPICDEWCNPLSTHLRDRHVDLLWEQMDIYEIPIEGRASCPFCNSHKPPRTIPCSHQDKGVCPDCLRDAYTAAIKKHLLSAHSGLLFERFRDLYPAHVTLPSKPASVNMGDDGEDEFNLYDVVSESRPLQDLMNCDLSPIQRKIVENILYNRASQLAYNAEVYNCTPEEFAREMESLKDTMALCGLEG